MRMVSLRLHGYRRYENQTTLDLTPRVVAIVGPNEAGKSTILDALENVCDPEVHRPFSSSELTWDVPADDDDHILSALFEIDEGDREALAEIPGADAVRLWHRWRAASGQAGARCLPEIRRDRQSREVLFRSLQRLLARTPKTMADVLDSSMGELLPKPEPSEEDSDGSWPREEEQELTLRAVAAALLDDLVDERDTLNAKARRRLALLGESFASLPPRAPKYVRAVRDQCARVAAEHAALHPNAQAREILDRRCPQVRVLRDSERQIRSHYPFEDFDEPPAPLENLLALAGVKWGDLKDAASEAGNPRLTTLLNRANRQLEERLHGSWRQAKVSIHLDEHQGALRVFPYDAASDKHSVINDRSQGFRSFLALLAFTTRHSAGARRLILAIDEAETHLHYNAQADLVNVLTRQTLAQQIVYTTHSAGCLPEDLSGGIRVAKTIDGARSAVENGFWSSNGSGGLTSLLMAMGAGAVAFTPARRAVICEGPSDALLLPALFRAALAIPPEKPLGLQVAGGLSWTPPQRLPVLEGEAAHVVYLTDSDEGGARYRVNLANAGVPADRIFVLRTPSVEGLSVEDFVDKATYAEVVTLLLRELRGYDGVPLRDRDIPSAGAARAVEIWAEQRKCEPPSKTAVAEHLLRVSGASLTYADWNLGGEHEHRGVLLRENRRETLVRLFSRIGQALRLEDVDELPGTAGK